MVTAGHPFGLCTLSSSSLHLKKLLRQLGFSLPKQDQLKKDLELEGPREGCQGQQWSLSVPRLQLLPDPLSSIRVPAAPAFPGSTAVPGTQRPHSKYTLTGDGLWSALFSSYNSQGWGRGSECRMSPRFSTSLLPSLPPPAPACYCSFPPVLHLSMLRCTHKVSSVVLRIKVFH